MACNMRLCIYGGQDGVFHRVPTSVFFYVSLKKLQTTLYNVLQEVLTAALL